MRKTDLLCLLHTGRGLWLGDTSFTPSGRRDWQTSEVLEVIAGALGVQVSSWELPHGCGA